MRRTGTIKKIIIAACASVLAMCAFGALSSIFANATCNHKWDDGKVTVNPTCQEAGEITYTCEKCGETKTGELDVVAHVWEPGAIIRYATCKEHGIQEYECVICDERDERLTPLIAHDYELILEVDSTCLEKGEKVYYCLDCKEYQAEYFQVHYIADPDGDGICNLCGIGMVRAEEGMSVANKWFRLYRAEDDPVCTPSWNALNLSDNEADLIAVNLSSGASDANYFTIGPWYSASIESGLKVVRTDEYIDFCFIPGVYDLDGDPETPEALKISFNTTIEGIVGDCYELIGYYED